MRLSGATYQTFAHNGNLLIINFYYYQLVFFSKDMKDLEKKLRAAIVHGHLRTNRPWKKIIIVVEGVYRLVNTRVRWVVDFWSRTFYLFSMNFFKFDVELQSGHTGWTLVIRRFYLNHQ